MEQQLATEGQRLRYYIERVLGMTIAEYTVRIGLPAASNTISNYCRDKYPITGKSVKLMITHNSNFPLEWITTGAGEIPKMNGKVNSEVDYRQEIIEELKYIIESQRKEIIRLNEVLKNIK